MAVEVLVLMEAVKLVGGLVKGTASLVEDIRSGWLAKNDKVKQELAGTIAKLEESLQSVSKLGRSAEGYSRTQENILELLILCRRAETFLKEHLAECRSRKQVSFEGNWKVLNSMMDTAKEKSEVPRQVVLARAEWYDANDGAQIDLLVQQFTAAFERGHAHARSTVADDLLMDLREMTRHLEDANTILRTTMYDKILRALQTVGA